MPQVEKKNLKSPRTILVPRVPSVLAENFDFDCMMVLPQDLKQKEAELKKKEILVFKDLTEGKSIHASQSKENISRNSE